MRDTCSLGKVFVINIESLNNISHVIYFGLNILSDEEDEDDNQNDDLEEDNFYP